MSFTICFAKRNKTQINLILHLKIKMLRENKWYSKTVSINMRFHRMNFNLKIINMKSYKIILVRLYNSRS